MKLKLRALLTGLLAIAVAAPVIATADRFTDVSADHRYADAIEWAYNRGLFKGYPDRSFKPDRPLAERELQIVVKRLFDSYDEITRAQTATILYHGITGLERNLDPPVTTTAPASTRPAVIEPSTIIAPKSPDPLLKVTIRLSEGDDFSLGWHRPGWENQGWKWRIRTDDPGCVTTDGVTKWYIESGSGLFDDGGLCPYVVWDDWQIEIVWDNDKRFVSEPCVTSRQKGIDFAPLFDCGSHDDEPRQTTTTAVPVSVPDYQIRMVPYSDKIVLQLILQEGGSLPERSRAIYKMTTIGDTRQPETGEMTRTQDPTVVFEQEIGCEWSERRGHGRVSVTIRHNYADHHRRIADWDYTRTVPQCQPVSTTTTLINPNQAVEERTMVLLSYQPEDTFIIQWLRPGSNHTWDYRIVGEYEDGEPVICRFRSGDIREPSSIWKSGPRYNYVYDTDGIRTCIEGLYQPFWVEVRWSDGVVAASPSCVSEFDILDDGEVETTWECQRHPKWDDWPSHYSTGRRPIR